MIFIYSTSKIFLLTQEVEKNIIIRVRWMAYIYFIILAIAIILAFIIPLISIIIYGVIVILFLVFTGIGKSEHVFIAPESVKK